MRRFHLTLALLGMLLISAPQQAYADAPTACGNLGVAGLSKKLELRLKKSSNESQRILNLYDDYRSRIEGQGFGKVYSWMSKINPVSLVATGGKPLRRMWELRSASASLKTTLLDAESLIAKATAPGMGYDDACALLGKADLAISLVESQNSVVAQLVDEYIGSADKAAHIHTVTTCAGAGAGATVLTVGAATPIGVVLVATAGAGGGVLYKVANDPGTTESSKTPPAPSPQSAPISEPAPEMEITLEPLAKADGGMAGKDGKGAGKATDQKSQKLGQPNGKTPLIKKLVALNQKSAPTSSAPVPGSAGQAKDAPDQKDLLPTSGSITPSVVVLDPSKLESNDLSDPKALKELEEATQWKGEDLFVQSQEDAPIRIITPDEAKLRKDASQALSEFGKHGQSKGPMLSLFIANSELVDESNKVDEKRRSAVRTKMLLAQSFAQNILDDLKEKSPGATAEEKIAAVRDGLIKEYFKGWSPGASRAIDLLEGKQGNYQALSRLLLSVIDDQSLGLPAHQKLGLQCFSGQQCQAVLHDEKRNKTWEIQTGRVTDNLVSPIEKPETLYLNYLLNKAAPLPDGLSKDQWLSKLMIAAPNTIFKSSKAQAHPVSTEGSLASVARVQAPLFAQFVPAGTPLPQPVQGAPDWDASKKFSLVDPLKKTNEEKLAQIEWAAKALEKKGISRMDALKILSKMSGFDIIEALGGEGVAKLLTKMDLSKLDTSKLNLAGFDLSKVDLGKVGSFMEALAKSNLDLNALSKIDFSKLDLSKLDFSGVDMSKLKIPDINLSGLDLSGLDFSKIDFSGKVDVGAMLNGIVEVSGGWFGIEKFTKEEKDILKVVGPSRIVTIDQAKAISKKLKGRETDVLEGNANYVESAYSSGVETLNLGDSGHTAIVIVPSQTDVVEFKAIYPQGLPKKYSEYNHHVPYFDWRARVATRHFKQYLQRPESQAAIKRLKNPTELLLKSESLKTALDETYLAVTSIHQTLVGAKSARLSAEAERVDQHLPKGQDPLTLAAPEIQSVQSYALHFLQQLSEHPELVGLAVKEKHYHDLAFDLKRLITSTHMLIAETYPTSTKVPPPQPQATLAIRDYLMNPKLFGPKKPYALALQKKPDYSEAPGQALADKKSIEGKSAFELDPTKPISAHPSKVLTASGPGSPDGFPAELAAKLFQADPVKPVQGAAGQPGISLQKPLFAKAQGTSPSGKDAAGTDQQSAHPNDGKADPRPKAGWEQEGQGWLSHGLKTVPKVPHVRENQVSDWAAKMPDLINAFNNDLGLSPLPKGHVKATWDIVTPENLALLMKEKDPNPDFVSDFLYRPENYESFLVRPIPFKNGNLSRPMAELALRYLRWIKEGKTNYSGTYSNSTSLDKALKELETALTSPQK